MPEIIVKKPFKFAHRGIHVEEFTPSDKPVETTDECAALAIAEKWAVRAPAGRRQAANEGASETAAHTGAAETKGAGDDGGAAGAEGG